MLRMVGLLHDWIRRLSLVGPIRVSFGSNLVLAVFTAVTANCSKIRNQPVTRLSTGRSTEWLCRPVTVLYCTV